MDGCVPSGRSHGGSCNAMFYKDAYTLCLVQGNNNVFYEDDVNLSGTHYQPSIVTKSVFYCVASFWNLDHL